MCRAVCYSVCLVYVMGVRVGTLWPRHLVRPHNNVVMDGNVCACACSAHVCVSVPMSVWGHV